MGSWATVHGRDSQNVKCPMSHASCFHVWCFLRAPCCHACAVWQSAVGYSEKERRGQCSPATTRTRGKWKGCHPSTIICFTQHSMRSLYAVRSSYVLNCRAPKCESAFRLLSRSHLQHGQRAAGSDHGTDGRDWSAFWSWIYGVLCCHIPMGLWPSRWTSSGPKIKAYLSNTQLAGLRLYTVAGSPAPAVVNRARPIYYLSSWSDPGATCRSRPRLNQHLA